jgi:hypothetical protein
MINSNCGESVGNVSVPPAAPSTTTATARLDDHPATATSPSTISTARFLVRLGKLILQNDRREWITVDELQDLARHYGIQIHDRTPNSKELERMLQESFRNSDELYADGINVVASMRRVKWDQVFMLRFYKYNPNYTPTNPVMGLGSCLPATVSN